MKKILVFILIILCLALPVFAQNWPGLRNMQPYALSTLVTSTTTTGATDGLIPLGMMFHTFTCMVTNPSGSVPTQVQTKLEGSIDGINLYTIMTNSASTFPIIFSTGSFSTSSLPAMYYKGTYISRATGSTNSSIQMDCAASH